MNADRSMLGPVKCGCRLRPGQLRRRYLRRHEREGAALLARVRGGALDDHDDTGPYDWCCYFASMAHEIAIADPRGQLDELARLVARKRFRARLVEQREAALLCHLPLVAPAAPSLVRARGGRTVEDALAEHLDILQDLPLPRDLPDEPRLCAGLAALGVLPLAAPLGELLKAYPKALVLLLLFAPLWRRPLQEFRPPSEVRGAALLDALVEHLLIVYPVPPFLLRTLHGPRTPALKWLCWIVLLGQGGSLVRAAPRGGWRVSARVQHYLRQAPPELEAEVACLWAQVRALGGSQQVMAWVSSHPGLRLDPTEGPKPLVLGWVDPLGGPGVTEPCCQCMRPSDDRNEERRQFLIETLRWLVQHRSALSDEGGAHVVDWALHLHTEAQRLNQVPFSWTGLGPRAALEEALRYKRALQCPAADLCWERRGWDQTAEAGGGWSVHELTSGLELQEEGQAQHHCVATYTRQCAEGRCVIFSLRYGEQRRLTVELDPSTGAVRQALGANNKHPLPNAASALAAWLRQRVLPALAGGIRGS